MLTLLFGVSGIFAPKSQVANAETTYTITFKKGDEVIKTMTVGADGFITEGDLPTTATHPDYLPELTNEYYRWFYSANNGQTLIRVASTGDPTAHAIENINSDIILWIKQFPNPNSYHKVTFILPDSTKVTKTVVNGGTVDEPIVDLGFCQRVKYDKSLANVTDDMIINVTIDNTYKYVFMGGCLAALVGSIVVIVIIIFKTLNIEDDDEDDIEFDAPKENNVE